MQNIGSKMARGAAWMVLFKLLERSIGLVSTIILARLLAPADFGLVAMATSIIAVLELLSAFSFDVILIQNPKAERRHYDTAWTLNVLFMLLCASLLLAIAYPASRFYQEPRLTAVIVWLALGNLAASCENIGTVIFRKEMQFNTEFRFLLLKKSISFVVTVGLALWFRSYWALVAGILTSRVSGVIISYWIHPYRPKPSLAAWHELFHFSKWLAINNIIYFLNNRAADFIVAKFAGSNALGLYSISFEIANLPTSEMAAPINRVVLPGFSKMAQDPAELRRGFLNVLAILAMLALPTGAGIAALADLLVPVVLGSKWLGTIPLIQILALFGMLTVLQNNCGVVYLAQGKPRLITLIAGANAALLLTLMLILISVWGPLGAALAYLLTVIIFLPLNFKIAAYNLQLDSRQILAVVWRPLSATLIMMLILRLSVSQLSASLGAGWLLLQLVITVILGASAYVLALLAFWWLAARPDGAERYVLNYLASAVSRAPLPQNQ